MAKCRNHTFLVKSYASKFCQWQHLHFNNNRASMYDSHSLTPSLIHIHIYSSLTSSVIWPADDGSSMYNTFYAATQMKERKKTHTRTRVSVRKKRNSSEIIIMVAILTNLPPFKYCINVNELNENNKTLACARCVCTFIQSNNSLDMVNAFNNASATNNFNVIKKWWPLYYTYVCVYVCIALSHTAGTDRWSCYRHSMLSFIS